jgi:hypothetical protein
MSGNAFDLNVIRVLEHWSTASALRELIANALDEAVLSKTASPDIIYEPASQTVRIRDYGRGLRHEHLTQNESSEKLSHPKTVIGKFGVGLKDALAVFDRLGISVSIFSRHENMLLVRYPKHGFPDITTLHVLVEPPSKPKFEGTEIILSPVAETALEEAKSLFLQWAGDHVLERTSAGAVLRRSDDGPARIYVNGLLVATEDEFLFSYDITSLTAALRKALNRERTNVGRTAYSERVKAILLATQSEEVAQSLADDLSNYQEGTIHVETNWNEVGLHAVGILNAQGLKLFLTPEQVANSPFVVSRAQDDGYEIVIVPPTLVDRFGTITDTNGSPIVDVGVWTERWNDSFVFDFVDRTNLTAREHKVFDKLDEVMQLVGGQPSNVAAVKISNSLRTDYPGAPDNCGGVWIDEENLIVIRRDQLQSIEVFAGTLLHELVHAIGGADDQSIEFENELTLLMGELAAKAISN